jgi:hypothetical protein
LARGAQPINRQTLEQGGETTLWLGPGHTCQPHPMFRAMRSRHFRMEQSLILTGIEMTPNSFWLMIVQWAIRATLRALPFKAIDVT